MMTKGTRGPHARSMHIALLVAGWMALAGILIGVGELVLHSGTVQGFDNHVTSVVVGHRSASLDAAMKAVTWLGSWVTLVVVAVVTLVFVLRRRLSVGFLVLAVVAWAGAQGGSTLAKHIVQRPRPPERMWVVSAHGWSWPSGHTATATLVFTFVAAVVWVLTPTRGPRLLAALMGVVAIVAVAFSRVELGVHWTTDVLASVVFVGLWLLIVGALFGPAFIGWSGVETDRARNVRPAGWSTAPGARLPR